VLRTHRSTGTGRAAIRRPGDPARGRVLIVDDERFVRDALARLLSSSHEVTVAESGEAALELVAHNEYDAIVCDVLMPKMDGRELYVRIAAEYPDLERRIIFMSGGTFSPDLEAFLAKVGCLDKPFKLDAVLRAIEERQRL